MYKWVVELKVSYTRSYFVFDNAEDATAFMETVTHAYDKDMSKEDEIFLNLTYKKDEKNEDD